MGNIIRKRRQPSEELDQLVSHIEELDKQLKGLIEQKTRTLMLMLYALVSISVALIGYIWISTPVAWNRNVAIIMVAVLSALIYFALSKLIMGIYDYLIGLKRKKINFLTERKAAIIEDVKENEKYKVAKEIIQKYSSEEEVKHFNDSPGTHKETEKETDTPNQEGRVVQRVPKLYENTPGNQFGYRNRTPIRPFVEQSSTPLDRILDYVMGESINNRYALVCANCRIHNGMALQEDFEKISFFCYKCNFYNPSRAEKSGKALSTPAQPQPKFQSIHSDTTIAIGSDPAMQKLAFPSSLHKSRGVLVDELFTPKNTSRDNSSSTEEEIEPKNPEKQSGNSQSLDGGDVDVGDSDDFERVTSDPENEENEP